MVKHVEIISIGNELLIGKTLNTNAQWLAKRITTLGLSVSQTTTIGDDVERIAETMQKAIQRKPDFIITTGGLGPTFDDKTLQGVAVALNTQLEVNEKALKMVTEKYNQYAEKMRRGKLELTPSRIKMATIPKTAKFCPNCGHQQLVFKECANCGKNLVPNAKFCSRCGHPAEEKPEPKFCSKCGGENLPESMFCNQCGEKL